MRSTFAIPFYSGRDYLRRAIASVLCQTHSAWQLLVCDDCGPEKDIADLVQSYGDPRLRYHRNEHNLGMAANWNRCLDLAPTDLVNILHADDELLPSYADVMIRAADQHPRAAAFFCHARIIDEHSRERFSFPDFFKRFLLPRATGPLLLQGRRGFESLLPGNFIMCPTVCYRKSVLGSRRFATDRKMVQDFDFFMRLLLDGDTLVGLPDVAYAYRRHAANATAAYTQSLLRFEEEADLFDHLGRSAADRHWNRAARLAADKRIIKLNLLYCILADMLHGQPRLAWRKLSFLYRLCVGRGTNPSAGTTAPVPRP